MKRVLLVIFITAVIFSVGCSTKSNNTLSSTKRNDTTAVTDIKKDNNIISPSETKQTTATVDTSTVNKDSKATKSETTSNTPQLSTKQKQQVNTQLNSAVKNIDDALKSLQDPTDINVDSVN